MNFYLSVLNSAFFLAAFLAFYFICYSYMIATSSNKSGKYHKISNKITVFAVWIPYCFWETEVKVFLRLMWKGLIKVRQIYRLISCHANSFSVKVEHHQLPSLKWYLDMQSIMPNKKHLLSPLQIAFIPVLLKCSTDKLHVDGFS